MTDKKTMADVADKLVDKLANGADKATKSAGAALDQVADAIKQVAPQAWDIAVKRELYEAAIAWGCWMVATVVLLLCAWKLFRCEKTLDSKNDFKGGPTAFGCLAIATALVTFGVPTGVFVPRMINPEYYAAAKLACAAGFKGACE